MRNVVALWGLVGVGVLAGACGGAPPAPEIAQAPGGAPAASPGAVASCSRLAPGTGAVRADMLRQSGTVVLARQGAQTIAYVADEDGKNVHTMDVDRGVELATTKLRGSPSQLLVLGDGRVAVALRDTNQVEVLEPAASAAKPLTSRCAISVPAEPIALALTPDDKRLLVTSAWDRTLRALDTTTNEMRTAFEVDLRREPRAVVVDDSGERAFVAHVVGARMSVVDLATEKHQVRELDLRVKKVVGGRPNADEKLREGCQGFALAKVLEVEEPKTDKAERPLGRGTPVPSPKPTIPARPRGRIFAPMVTVNPGDPNVRSPAYYGDMFDGMAKEAPLVSVIDADAERPITKTAMSLGQRLAEECLLPRSATVRASTGTLFVTCLGIDAVVELDTRGLDPARLERRRWNVAAGPTGIAIDDAKGRAYVWSQYDGKLATIDLAAKSEEEAVKVARVSAPSDPVAAEVALGRRLFHATDDKRISSDGSACASCHPEGREDAMTWSTPDGPRQTIMLAGRTENTAPYGWLGKHDNLKGYLGSTFTRLGGTGLQGAELEALAGYVSTLRGPTPAEASDKALLAHGRDLFFDEKQGCATCHLGGEGTDRTHHDVGSKATADVAVDFDTPSLRFVSGSAPYFHDGRYTSLDQVLAATDNQMGHTMHLSRHDAAALKVFLEKL